MTAPSYQAEILRFVVERSSVRPTLAVIACIARLPRNARIPVDDGCSQPMGQPISEIALRRTYSKRAPKSVGT